VRILEALLPVSPANHESVRSRAHVIALQLEATDRQAAAEITAVRDDTATPKEGGREGPSLEELLTTIIMQGREQIGILKTIQEEQIRSAETLPQAVADAVLEQLGPARHARS
jgi:hypothetical protein